MQHSSNHTPKPTSSLLPCHCCILPLVKNDAAVTQKEAVAKLLLRLYDGLMINAATVLLFSMWNVYIALLLLLLLLLAVLVLLLSPT